MQGLGFGGCGLQFFEEAGPFAKGTLKLVDTQVALLGCHGLTIFCEQFYCHQNCR